MNVAGLTFSFFGVGLVVLNGSFKFDASPPGVGLEFIAVFAAIAYSLVLKNLVSRYNTLSIIAYQNIIGIVLFLPIWLIFEFKDFTQRPFHPEAFRAIILRAVFHRHWLLYFSPKVSDNWGLTAPILLLI